MRRIAALATLLAAVLCAGCAAPGVGTDGDLTNGWSMIGTPVAARPRVGACIETWMLTASMADYRTVSCRQPHLTETVHVGAFTGAVAEAERPPPVPSPATTAAYRECSRRATAYVGAPWRTGRLGVTLVLPSNAGWSGGARWFRCDLSATSGDSGDPVARTGSLTKALRGAAPLRLRCFNPTVRARRVQRMTPVSCQRKHHAEFVGLWRAPDIAYEKLKADDETTAKGCRRVIARFAGVPDDAMLRYRAGWISYVPGTRDWALGERQVQCYLWLTRRHLTRSVRGAGSTLLPINYTSTGHG